MECPRCGKGLIPASARGYIGADGEEQIHAFHCRCRWCRWWWMDDEPPHTCECGCVAIIVAEDGYAQAVEVT